MDIEDKGTIDLDLKCVHNVMSNFEDELCDRMQNKVNGIREYIEKQQAELEKKEAIINEMAKTINKEYYKDIIENYTKKEEKEGIKE